jgi:hypothetical protein
LLWALALANPPMLAISATVTGFSLMRLLDA